MTKSKREEIYNKYNGHCAYCGKVIDIKDMQIDHQKPKRDGGSDCIENLFPACRRCNHYKRAKGLESFRIYIKTLHERIENDYITKVGIDYGIVVIEPFNGYFYFEMLDREIWEI